MGSYAGVGNVKDTVALLSSGQVNINAKQALIIESVAELAKAVEALKAELQAAIHEVQEIRRTQSACFQADLQALREQRHAQEVAQRVGVAAVLERRCVACGRPSSRCECEPADVPDVII